MAEARSEVDRCRGGPHSDDDAPTREVTPGTPGVARELLDHVADIANILAYRNARRVNDLPTSRRAAGRGCSENEVASIPIDVLMVLPSVCALARHGGDHRREADQADHDHCEHAHHPTAQSIKRAMIQTRRFRGGQPPLTTALLRAAGIIARLGSGRNVCCRLG